jgi:hypothetical protein
MKLGLHFATGFLLVTGLAGCADHRALRELFSINASQSVDETSLRCAVLEKYPRGTPMPELLSTLRPDGKAVAGLEIRQHERDDIMIESQDAVPRPPGQASWIVIDLKACEGCLHAVEVYRRYGTL